MFHNVKTQSHIFLFLSTTKKNKMKADKTDNKEAEFKQIGIDAFFNVECDKNINWKEFFHLSEEEEYYRANNNQIIEDDKNEDQI